jgi:hypothetical protein
MVTITGGSVSFGPPVGVIVEAHLVNRLPTNSNMRSAVSDAVI